MRSIKESGYEQSDAARMWGAGGRAYDDVSFAISDALAHAAQRLNATEADYVLDVATGTGWTARNAARRGARVEAIDFAEELIEAARQLSAHVRPAIGFHVAGAERLPFPDGAFSKVISTFGVMFAADQRQAAAELARTCRKGGRLVIASWSPGSVVQEFFAVIGKHSGAPAPVPSPLAWGDREHVRALLGDAFDLIFEPGVNNAYHESVEDIWQWYRRGFGPVRALADSLDAERLAAFKRDIDAYHGHYAVEAGLHIRREYLVAIGTRR